MKTCCPFHRRLVLGLTLAFGMTLLVSPLSSRILASGSGDERSSRFERSNGDSTDQNQAYTLLLPLLGRNNALRGQAKMLIGGEIGAVASEGRHVFVGQGHRIAVFEGLEGVGLRAVGETAPFAAPVSDMLVHGQQLFVVHESLDAWYRLQSDPSAGLSIYDIEDPARPRLEGYVATPGPAVELILRHPYAFVREHWTGVSIIDVSDGAHPRIVSRPSAGTVTQMALTNNHLWQFATSDCPDRACSRSGPRLIAYDISRPAEPLLARRFEGLDWQPGYLVVTDTALRFGAQRIDLEGDVASWAIEPDTDWGFQQVFEREGRTWAIRQDAGQSLLAELQLEPGRGVHVDDRVALPSGAEQGAPFGHYFLWPSLDKTRFHWLEFERATPEIGTTEVLTVGGLDRFATIDGETGIVGEGSALAVVDLVPNGRILSHLDESSPQFYGYPMKLTVDEVLYSGYQREGISFLRAVDLSDPAHPGDPQDQRLSGAIRSMAVGDSLIALAEWGGVGECSYPNLGRVSLWSRNEALLPAQVALIAEPRVGKLALHDSTLLIVRGGCSGYEILGYDLSNPIAPIALPWSLPLRYEPVNLLVMDGRLVIVSSNQLRILELRGSDEPHVVFSSPFWKMDEENPTEVGFVTTIGAWGEELLLGGQGGIARLSLADPSQPRFLSHHRVPRVLSMHVVDDELVVANPQGIWFFDLR